MTCARCTTPGKCALWGCVPGTFPSEPKDPRVAREMQHLFDVCVPQPPRAPTSTVPTTIPASTGTTEQMLAAIEKLLADIPPEPIGEWMREQGFPPETSLVLLPETMRSQLPVWPKYVRFSLDVGEPVLAKDVLPAQATVEQIWRGMAP